jgi:plasmid maintenance system antidote protein VapI
MAGKQKKSERNDAAVRYLKSLQVLQTEKVTYADLSQRTGIPENSIKNLLSNRADFTVDHFLSIANALGADDATAYRSLAEITLKK